MRVLSEDAQCTEVGPFFPTTARYVIQNGFSLDQDILQAPDWLVILLLFVAILLAICIVIIALVSHSVDEVLAVEQVLYAYSSTDRRTKLHIDHVPGTESITLH